MTSTTKLPAFSRLKEADGRKAGGTVPPLGRPSGGLALSSAARMISGGPGVRKRSYSFSEGEQNSNAQLFFLLFYKWYIYVFPLYRIKKLLLDPLGK